MPAPSIADLQVLSVETKVTEEGNYGDGCVEGDDKLIERGYMRLDDVSIIR